MHTSRTAQLLIALCLAGVYTHCMAAPNDMCRTMCRSEQDQCIKDIVKSGWLESARRLLENHSSKWRSSNDNPSDTTSWLQQRHEKNLNDKAASNEQKMQCDTHYVQCTQSCISAAAIAVPQGAASAPFMNPSPPQ